MGSEAGRYRFAAWTLGSDVTLPELPTGAGAPAWQVTGAPVTLAQRRASWYQKTSAIDGLPWVWLGRREHTDVIRFPGLAWCELHAARRITCAWRRHLGHEEPEHLLINHVLPLAASREGYLVLHASVVARPGGGAIALIGPVGAGKSTLAAYLASRGWRLLSDDRLILDHEHRAHPTAPYVRLSPDAARQLGVPATPPAGHHKVRVALGPAGWPWETTPSALEAVAFLRRATRGIRIETLRGHETALELFTSVLQLGLDRAEVRARVFDSVGALAGSVPCVRLHVPPEWSSLRDTEAALARL